MYVGVISMMPCGIYLCLSSRGRKKSNILYAQRYTGDAAKFSFKKVYKLDHHPAVAGSVEQPRASMKYTFNLSEKQLFNNMRELESRGFFKKI